MKAQHRDTFTQDRRQPGSQSSPATLKAVVLLASVLMAACPLARAQAGLSLLRHSADVSTDLALTPLNDEDIAEEDPTGSVSSVNIGPIPSVADLDAYHLLPSGNHLLSFDTTIELPGAVTASPGDVVLFDGQGYSLAFSASGHDLPAGLNLDAVSALNNGDLLASFDASFSFLGEVIDDEDLVRISGGVVSVYLDGSSEGVPTPLDVDAIHYVEGEGTLLLSFDSSGGIGGLRFDDEDVVAYEPSTGIWSMLYDGSAEHAGWSKADLDSLYAGFLPAEIFSDGFESGTLAEWSAVSGQN